MSAGIRSGVNWMRWNLPARLRAMALPISVLPTPGTSSNSMCSPAKQRDHGQPDRVGLAEDDARDILLQLFDEGCGVILHPPSIGGKPSVGKSCTGSTNGARRGETPRP